METTLKVGMPNLLIMASVVESTEDTGYLKINQDIIIFTKEEVNNTKVVMNGELLANALLRMNILISNIKHIIVRREVTTEQQGCLMDGLFIEKYLVA